MERSRLRAATGIWYALLNPILDELMKEGRVRISGEIISLTLSEERLVSILAMI